MFRIDGVDLFLLVSFLHRLIPSPSPSWRPLQTAHCQWTLMEGLLKKSWRRSPRWWRPSRLWCPLVMEPFQSAVSPIQPVTGGPVQPVTEGPVQEVMTAEKLRRRAGKGLLCQWTSRGKSDKSFSKGTGEEEIESES